MDIEYVRSRFIKHFDGTTGQNMIPDAIEADQDIDVTVTGTAAEVWIRLKKISGYTSGSETSVYGQYDDPEVVGE
jgi:hypothetical protein